MFEEIGGVFFSELSRDGSLESAIPFTRNKSQYATTYIPTVACKGIVGLASRYKSFAANFLPSDLVRVEGSCVENVRH